MLAIITILSIVLLDQVTKNLIIGNISVGNSFEVIPGFFYISHFKNTGIAWSLLSNKLPIIIPLTIIIILMLGYYLFKVANNNLIKISLSLLLGGAIGNLIDRVMIGSVTDFLEFHFGTYIFPVFNVADIFIVVGEILLVFYVLFIYKEEKTKL